MSEIIPVGSVEQSTDSSTDQYHAVGSVNNLRVAQLIKSMHFLLSVPIREELYFYVVIQLQ